MFITWLNMLLRNGIHACCTYEKFSQRGELLRNKKNQFFFFFSTQSITKLPFLKTKPFFQRFTPSQQSVSEWGESRSIFFLRRLQLLRSVAALLQQKLILHPRRVPNEKKTRMMLLCLSVCYVRCVCLFVTFVRPSVRPLFQILYRSSFAWFHLQVFPMHDLKSDRHRLHFQSF